MNESEHVVNGLMLLGQDECVNGRGVDNKTMGVPREPHRRWGISCPAKRLGPLERASPYGLWNGRRHVSWTEYSVKNDVFWDVTPCGSCKNRRFGGT
jgi:hypothetical protein